MSNRSFLVRFVVLVLLGSFGLGCRVRSRSQPEPGFADAAAPWPTTSSASEAASEESDAGSAAATETAEATPLESLRQVPQLLWISGFGGDEPPSAADPALAVAAGQLADAMLPAGRAALVEALEAGLARRSELAQGSAMLGGHIELSCGWNLKWRSPAAFGVRRAWEALWGPPSEVRVPRAYPEFAANSRLPMALLLRWRPPADGDGAQAQAAPSEYLAVALWEEPNDGMASSVAWGAARADARGAVVALAADPGFDTTAAIDAVLPAIERLGVAGAAQRGLREAQRGGRAAGLIAVLVEERALIRTNRAAHWGASAALEASAEMSALTSTPSAAEVPVAPEPAIAQTGAETGAAMGAEDTSRVSPAPAPPVPPAPASPVPPAPASSVPPAPASSVPPAPASPVPPAPASSESPPPPETITVTTRQP